MEVMDDVVNDIQHKMKLIIMKEGLLGEKSTQGETNINVSEVINNGEELLSQQVKVVKLSEPNEG